MRYDNFDLIWTFLFVFLSFLAFIANPTLSPQLMTQVFIIGILIRILFTLKGDFYSIASAKTAFWVGIIYTILLNPAMGSEKIRIIPPQYVLKSSMLVFSFIGMVLIGYKFGPIRPKGYRFNKFIPSLEPGILFILIYTIFIVELLRRLYFVGWSFDGMIYDMLKGRSGEVRYGRGQFGDWKVFLQPIEMLCSWLPCIVAYYWSKEKFNIKKLMTLIPMLLVLASAFFGGSRGALAVPLAAFLVFRMLSSSRKIAKRYMYVTVILSFLLAPMMDLMVNYRGKGWHEGVEITSIVGNPLTAQRDTNFEALAQLVSVVPSVEPFRSPLELYFFMIITPIPRVLWPSKPWMSQDYLGSARAYYASISCVGDMYFYGGLFHIIIGGFIFGVALRYIDRFYLLARQRSELLLFYILSLIAMVWTLRAIFSLVMAGIIASVFLIFFLSLNIFSRKNKYLLIAKP